MIYMHQFIPDSTWVKLQRLQRRSGLHKAQLRQAYDVTKDTVLQYLRRQLMRGNWREVQEVLKGKPMTSTGKLLHREMRSLVVGKLIMRLGLRKITAAALALVLLPLIFSLGPAELLPKVRS